MYGVTSSRIHHQTHLCWRVWQEQREKKFHVYVSLAWHPECWGSLLTNPLKLPTSVSVHTTQRTLTVFINYTGMIRLVKQGLNGKSTNKSCFVYGIMGRWARWYEREWKGNYNITVRYIYRNFTSNGLKLNQILVTMNMIHNTTKWCESSDNMVKR